MKQWHWIGISYLAFGLSACLPYTPEGTTFRCEDGATCNQPPPPTCLDGSTLQTYTSDGNCIDKPGACTYPAQTTTCLRGQRCSNETGNCITAISVAAAANHTCALLSDGEVRCWGSNYYGQLGNGTRTNSSTPVAVTGLTGAIAVAAGYGHTCAVVSGGEVRCWGTSNLGELGNGTTAGFFPTPVSVTDLSGATAVASGSAHTCALLSNGTVECWGRNDSGQLGNGTRTNSSIPVLVTGLSAVTAIAAGGSRSCALLSDGKVECWGMNAPPAPAAIPGLNGARVVAVGGAHSCALSDDVIQCWGQNDSGQIGNGTTTTDSNQVAPVAVSGLSEIITVIAGGHSTCALLLGGTIECWGNNEVGQLGNGTKTNFSIPVQVAGVSGAIAVSGGSAHICALLDNGDIQCWGNNVSGELGNGTTTESPTPVSVKW